MPEWLSIKNKPGKPLPTRTIIKNHLKEWNTDEDEEEERTLEEIKEAKAVERYKRKFEGFKSSDDKI